MSGGTAHGNQQYKFVTRFSQGVGLVLPTGRSGITTNAITAATMPFDNEYIRFPRANQGDGVL